MPICLPTIPTAKADNRHRFQPPQLNLEKSNIVNSENTALFLFSCFQYILTSIILNVGPPFRQPMTVNGKHRSISYSKNTNHSAIVPYLCTIIVDIAIAGYMLFRPSKWVVDVMQLTSMSDTFRGWLLVLALGFFALSWVAQNVVFPRLARMVGNVRIRLQRNYRKKRRQYKVLLEEMRM